MSADVVATLPGKPLERINMRAGDDRVFQIDCAPLLRQHELLAAIGQCEAIGIEIAGARTRQGRLLEVRISTTLLGDGITHTDHVLRASVKTSQGAVGVAVAVRVHA